MEPLWLIRAFSVLAMLIQDLCSASALKKACEDYASTGAQAVYKWNSCITYPDDRYDWMTSKSKCDQFDNGHLLVLPVVEMLDIIQSFTGLEDSFLGAAQVSGSSEPYGGWEWCLSGGRVVTMLMQIQRGMGIWGDDEPNQYAGYEEDCLHFRGYDQEIQDTLCTNVEKRFCQYDDPKTPRIYTKSFPKSKGSEAGKLAEYGNVTVIGCANKCSADSICHSISFKQDDGHCVLNLDDGTYPGFEAQSDQDYDVYVWKWG